MSHYSWDKTTDYLKNDERRDLKYLVIKILNEYIKENKNKNKNKKK